ncbi:unnamed protein product [Discosporangium mesarthrocarpum]
MSTPLVPLKRAGLFPPVEQVEAFASRMVKVSGEGAERPRLSEVFKKIAGQARTGSRFFLGDYSHMLPVADALHDIKGLSLADGYSMCMAPVNHRDSLAIKKICEIAEAHVAGVPASLNLRIPRGDRVARNVVQLSDLCSKHGVLDLYAWMSHRFPRIQVTAERLLADRQQDKLLDLISKALLHMDPTDRTPKPPSPSQGPNTVGEEEYGKTLPPPSAVKRTYPEMLSTNP